MKRSAVGAQGESYPFGGWIPSDNGMIVATADPLTASSSATFGGGVLQVQRMRLTSDTDVTNIHSAPRTPAGSGITTALFGLYDQKGTLLGQSADQSTQVTNAGDFKAALATPVTSLRAGTVLYVAMLMAASTTSPTFRTIPLGSANHNLVAGTYRFFTLSSGLTALPGTITLTSGSGAGSVPWMGLS